jgi:hypothetical protein
LRRASGTALKLPPGADRSNDHRDALPLRALPSAYSGLMPAALMIGISRFSSLSR